LGITPLKIFEPKNLVFNYAILRLYCKPRHRRSENSVNFGSQTEKIGP